MQWLYVFLGVSCLLMAGMLLTINCRSRFWLAGFLFFLSSYLGLIVLDAQDYYISPKLYFLLLSVIFLPGPLLLGYISHISTHAHVSVRDFLPMALPLLMLWVCNDIFPHVSWWQTAIDVDYEQAGYMALFNLLSAFAGVTMLVYVASAAILLRTLKKNWAGYQSQTLPKSWHQMAQVILATVLVTICQVWSAFGHPAGDAVSIGDIGFILYVLFFLYIAASTAWENFKTLNFSPLIAGESLAHEEPDAQKADVDMQLAAVQLREVVLEQGVYLQSDLTLSMLAQTLASTPNKLSMIINQGYGKTFYEFINDLRVQFAAKMLLEHPEFTITQVMYDSGFTAKSTFYSHFKKAHKRTPSEYRAQHHASL